MIRGFIFDLDGTLVQSEKLKAQSFAIAVQQVLGLTEPDARAVDAYREVVGASREVAARHIVEPLDLSQHLTPLMGQNEAEEPWQVLAKMRVSIYNDTVADPQVLRDNRWPHTIELLRLVSESGCRTALATMSYKQEALHVLRALDLEAYLDVVLTREDVERPKPDPEIYLLAAQRLEADPTAWQWRTRPTGSVPRRRPAPTSSRWRLPSQGTYCTPAGCWTMPGLYTIMNSSWIWLRTASPSTTRPPTDLHQAHSQRDRTRGVR